MSNADLTAERLRSLLDYNAESGVFTWLAGRRACQEAGYINTHLGYRMVYIDGSLLYAHRLAFMYVTGNYPNGQVDHVNGVRADNRWINLRDVSVAVNRQNLRSAMLNNKSGFLGVCRGKGEKWRATIMIGKKQTSLGTFDTPEAAHAAYVQAKRMMHEGNTL